MIEAQDAIEVASRPDGIRVDTQGERVLSAPGAYALASRLIDAAAATSGETPLRAFLDKVIVHRVVESNRTTGGGVHLPDTAQQPAHRGVVLSIGPGKFEGGQFVAIEGLKVGDIVSFSQHAGYEIKVGDGSYLTIRQADILAVVTATPEPVSLN